MTRWRRDKQFETDTQRPGSLATLEQAPPPPNQPPIVMITGPSDGTTVPEGQALFLTATATHARVFVRLSL